VKNGGRFWPGVCHGFDTRMVAAGERPRILGRRDEEKEACISNEKGRRKKKRERERSEKEGGGGGRRRSLLAWIFKSCQLHPFRPFIFFPLQERPIQYITFLSEELINPYKSITQRV
jgi:hypothetical protein